MDSTFPHDLPVRRPVSQKKGLGMVFKKYAWLYIIIIAVALSFYAGTQFGNSGQADSSNPEQFGQVDHMERIPDYLGKDVDAKLLQDVWEKVQQNHIDKNTPDIKLFYGALEGIVASLDDPYSVYFDPETAKKFQDDLSGSFEGIGAEIGFKDGQLSIVAPIEDMPAEKAGLLAGDAIIEIDGTSTLGMSLDEAVNRIRGEKGTDVTLTIFREGETETREVIITRDTIVIHSVKWEMREDGIAYIRINNFHKDTEGLFSDAVREAVSANASGVILDLRNNPGGFLDTAIQIAGYWVNGKTVVIERFGDGKEDTYKARTPARFEAMPTVVLVNKGSASASEIVAGALQDHDKATIVGKTTFGKGSVQNLEDLRDGSALKLTIAKWLTPNGRTIDKEGIAPDIEVERSGDDIENERDPQLDEAVRLLSQ